MTADEIQVAADRAEEKRAELPGSYQLPGSMPSGKVFTMLPCAAEAYRRQITHGVVRNNSIIQRSEPENIRDGAT